MTDHIGQGLNCMQGRAVSRPEFLFIIVLTSLSCALQAWTETLPVAEANEKLVMLHFHAAQKAMQSHNPELAAQEFETVLRLDPTLVEAHINLGLAYHLLGKYDMAARQLSEGLRARPQVLGANIILGVDYLKLGLPKNAMAPLQAALTIEPSNREARRNLAAAYLAENEYVQAGKEFRDIFAREPDKEEGWYSLGHAYLYMATQLIARAGPEYQGTSWGHHRAGDVFQARGLWSDAVREYRRALSLEPRQSELHASLGDLLLQMGQLHEAEAEFQNELGLDSWSVYGFMGLTEAYLARGDAAAALQCVSKVIEISPQFAARLESFPSVSFAHEMSTRLVVELKKSSPQPAKGFLLWAVYKSLGETDNAEEERKSFEEQIAGLERTRTAGMGQEARSQACRHNAFAACIRELQAGKNLGVSDYLNLGKSHFALREFESAADAFGAALARAPQNPGAAYWLTRVTTILAGECFKNLVAQFPDSWRTHQLRAEDYHLRQDDKPAIEEYQIAARLRPDALDIHRALGELYLSNNSFEKAKKELEDALRLDPADARGLYLMGRWYFGQSQPQKAITYLEHALQCDPNLLEARGVLGKAYLRTGQAARAAPELEKALALDHYGDLHYMLYRAYHDLGKEALAQKALAQSQTLRQKSQADDQAKIQQATED